MNEKSYISKHIFLNEVLWQQDFITNGQLEKIVFELKNKQQHFNTLTLNTRIQLIASIAEVLTVHRSDFAQMICEEVGRCITECEAEIDKTIKLVEYYTQIAPTILEPKEVATQASQSRIYYEPLGLIAAIMPWNYPIWQMLRFMIPALCAGNACIIKPAPSVGRVTEKFFQLINPTLPIDFALLSNEQIENLIELSDGVAFTGSVATGKIIAGHAARHLKKTVLELGGSNAFIVLADADLRLAAKDACYSRFRDAGQSCNAAKRLFVEECAFQEFTTFLLAEVKQISWGKDPMLRSSKMGPLHLEGAPLKMQELVKDALANGAKCLCGGIEASHPAFYPPTVLSQITENCRILSEEVFGPILPIVTIRDIDEAISFANHTEFGLGASIYTNDATAIDLGIKQLQVGSLYINRHTSSDLHLPFGGVKHSGYGRELSEYGLIEFVNVKSFWQR